MNGDVGCMIHLDRCQLRTSTTNRFILGDAVEWIVYLKGVVALKRALPNTLPALPGTQTFHVPRTAVTTPASRGVSVLTTAR